MTGISDEAITPFVEFLAALSPTTDLAAQSLLTLAYRALTRKRYHAAQELYGEIVQHDPVSEAGFVGLALAHHCTAEAMVAHRYASQAQIINQHLNGNLRSAIYPALLAKVAPKPQPPAAPRQKNASTAAWWTHLVQHHPRQNALDAGNDASAAIASFDKFFLDGFVPPTPPIARGADIATIGSCFASHISQHLHYMGRKPLKTDNYYDNVHVDDEFFNTYVLREAFEIAFGHQDGGRNWSDDPSNGTTRAVHYRRSHARQLLGSADAYIITLGLAEIWYDKVDGAVYPTGLNIETFDEARHGFRLATPEENLANLSRIVDMIRTHRGDVPIIVTLSPVPLSATFRPMNCVGANTISKAVLRVAIDMLMGARMGDKQLFYFPSYEIVTAYFRDPFESDLRHVRTDVVDFIMRTFERTFLAP